MKRKILSLFSLIFFTVSCVSASSSETTMLVNTVTPQQALENLNARESTLPYIVMPINTVEPLDSKTNLTKEQTFERITTIINQDFQDYLIQDILMFDDIVITYYSNKVILAKYNKTEGSLEYIPFPDTELLNNVYDYLKINDYDYPPIPKDFLVALQSNTFDYDKYTKTKKLDDTELSKYIDMYHKEQYKNQDFPQDVMLNGYKFDISNDNKEDIILEEIYGTNHYRRIYYFLNGESHGQFYNSNTQATAHLLDYENTNYLVQEDSYLINGDTSLFYINNSKDVPKKISLHFDNYNIGFNLINQSYAKGYENIPIYIIDSAQKSLNCNENVTGSAETLVLLPNDRNSFRDPIFSHKGDYNNDGKIETIFKSNVLLSSYGSFMLLKTEDTKLQELLDITYKDNQLYPQSIYLDKTEYGNILMVALGYDDEVSKIIAYKITDNNYLEVGSINLEPINFKQISSTTLND